MTDKPENKTIEQIRDELMVSYDPTHDIEMAIKVNDVNGICDCIVNAYEHGFDARGKIEEERTKKLVEACNELYYQLMREHGTKEKILDNRVYGEIYELIFEALQEWGSE